MSLRGTSTHARPFPRPFPGSNRHRLYTRPVERALLLPLAQTR